MAKTVHFKKIAIIGVGLIGGSLSLVLKQKGMVESVAGIGRGLENLQTAKRLGVVDSFTQDVSEGVKDADLVVVATPVLKIAETIKKALPSLKEGCIITDVGSVKEALINQIEPMLPASVHFVPGHPIAGTEHSGAEAAFPELFINRKCILTPTEKTGPEALNIVKAVWEAAGSQVVVMDAATHDSILAAVSHLPHMIAYSLVNAIGDIEAKGTDALSYSAGGFKDFTRIASSSPEMWSDICALNKNSIVSVIEDFQARLEKLKNQIKASDLKCIKEDFERAKNIRDSLLQRQNNK
ncbi:MAG: prephenate dehydrogenase/arogenate dehydrogenase family protein [Deltaproteobacteria bacterium]|nr:prephenate dehydrogenase/arogenate dehydrogenase family protein [Deltaproteobacteria bacterium]